MKEKKIVSAVSEQFLARLGLLWPAIKGSLAQVRKPCIRPHCQACASGKKHPNYLLAFTSKGRRKCLYVPIEMVTILKAALENGRKVEKLLYEMGPALLKEYRTQNPAKTGPTARPKRRSSKKNSTNS
jgi:hypothetical protein